MSALEAWRAHHTNEIGPGGAAQRVEELARLMKQMREVGPKMAAHEDTLNHVIRTSNDNLTRILQAVADVEQAIRKDTRPIAAALDRLNQRVATLEWKVGAE